MVPIKRLRSPGQVTKPIVRHTPFESQDRTKVMGEDRNFQFEDHVLRISFKGYS